MTISKRVQKELYSAAPAGVLPPLAVVTAQQQPPSRVKGKRGAARGPKKTKSERALTAALAAESKGKAWTDEEHARFLEALRVYPSGPWKAIADFVGTKNSRQTMTHAQKYRQKHERRERGLRNRTKHRKAARTLVDTSSTTVTALATAPTATASRSSAMTRSQTSAKRVTSHETLVIPSTPRPGAISGSASHASESPRSGEENTAASSNSVGGGAYIESLAVEALMASVDADAFDDGGASWEQLKVSSISEMFQDFEPIGFLPTMWSTTSLGDIDVAAPPLPPLFANELFSDAASANPLWG